MNENKPAKIVLREIVDSVYRNAWEAKERGEPVGWSSSKFPAEIAETLGLAVCYPENQAAAIAAKHGGQRMCEHAEAMGFSNDICAYARISLAYADGAPCEEKPMPQPDFLLCCNNICNCMTKWYESIARMHGIPLIMIDVPFNNTVDVPDERIAYVRAQFDAAVKKLEAISGRKWDEKKFEEVCANANRSASAWLKACSYCATKPSPLSGFDLFNHMADIVTARCKPETAAAFEQLAAEYEKSVKDGESTWRYDENHRIMFEGIPCWPELGTLFKPLKENGTNTVAVVYAPAFGFVYDGLDELARAYCRAPNSVCIEAGVAWREDLCRENGVDGILVHYNRSCKPWSGYMLEMERRWHAKLGVPVVGFDGDQADPRNFSEAQYRTRVEGLVELMRAQSKGAHAGGPPRAAASNAANEREENAR
ncbi:MAG: 2-hydroxyacyl-CoA dehydratase [Clostridiales Family XIII bacterium]|jgi:benzoyl-CoA reductase/2-hydroxyglutaryl-CoA dehydratase subunit BcrC/BadD/HgdB|nr:2-hydroxyacyl-CoA dehydratase [Clostridiales Family XIII bacterium]